MSFKNKNNLLKLLCFLVILIPFILLFSLNINSIKPAISEHVVKQKVKADLNGDGNEDFIYIDLVNKNNYSLTVDINENNYELIPNKSINSLGIFSPEWPITLNILDLDRNNIPEIIVQSSEKNNPIQHLFKWTGSDFQDIFYSTNNILGIIDSNNGKTPKILSFSLNDSKENIQKYMLLNKKVKNISYDSVESPGFQSIISFIDIISLNYEIDDLPNIFTSYISSQDLSQLWRLDKDLYYYNFQDAFFRDISWDNKGNISTCSWSLNFYKISKENTENKSQINFTVQLEKIKDTFLISSINLTSKK